MCRSDKAQEGTLFSRFVASLAVKLHGGAVMMTHRLSCLICAHFSALIFFLYSPPSLVAQSGQDILGRINQLPSKERTDRLVEGARRERGIVWYSTTQIDQARSLIDRFSKKYSFVEAQYYRANSERLLERILLESRAGKLQADVIALPLPEATILQQKGILARYPSAESKAFPDFARQPDGYWTSWTVTPIACAYNTNLVRPNEVPRGYEELLNARWKNNMAMDLESTSWFASVLRLLEKKLGSIDKAMAYMDKLGQQGIQFRVGHTLLNNLLAAGEFALGPELRAHTIEKLKRAGAPVNWVALENTIFVQTHNLSVSALTSRPHAAALFVDFILSAEGMKAASEVQLVPSRVDAPSDFLQGKGYTMHPVPMYGDREIKLYKELLVKGYK